MQLRKGLLWTCLDLLNSLGGRRRR